MTTPRSWSPCRVRFMASGRADQTPVALRIAGRWLGVSLLQETLVASPDPTDEPRRRFRVRTAGGLELELRRRQGKKWRFRRI